MSDFIKMDYFDWCEEYKPILNHIDSNQNGELTRFETYGPELEYVKSVAEKEPGRVWTELDCDGEMIIGDGFHFVNRMAYYITEVPAKPNTDYEID